MAKRENLEKDYTANPCPSVEDLNNLPMSCGFFVKSFRGITDGATVIRTVGGWIYNFTRSTIFIPDPLQADPPVAPSPTKKTPKAPPKSSRPK